MIKTTRDTLSVKGCIKQHEDFYEKAPQTVRMIVRRFLNAHRDSLFLSQNRVVDCLIKYIF